MAAQARRVIIFRDSETRRWRYKVQGMNWRTLEASAEGMTRRSSVERKVARLWPGVEVVVEP